MREIERAQSSRASRRRLLGVTAGGGAALAGVVLAGGLTHGAAEAQPSDTIVGSWLVHITGSQDANEQEMVSFTSDGIALATNTPVTPPDPDAGPNASPSYSTPGHGAWVKTGDRQFRTTFIFIQDGPDGLFQVSVKITLRLTLSADGSSISGPYAIEVRDAQDAMLFTSPGDAGTVQGARIVA